MSDDFLEIMSSLGLDYQPAIDSTKAFESTIENLNKQLAKMKESAIQSAKDVNSAFSSQLGDKKVKDMFTQMQKENKPIEIKVVTDKAENAMNEFARSMGIKLDKNMQGQFKGLAGSLLGEFDQGKFDELANNITNSYVKAQETYMRKLSKSEFQSSEDLRFYEELRTRVLKLSENTLDAKANMDGFRSAIRGVVETSKNVGEPLDEMAASFRNLGFQNIDTDQQFARQIIKSVNAVREFRQGFTDLGKDVPTAEIEGFVKDSLSQLIVKLGQIDHESKQATTSLEQIAAVGAPMQTVNTIIDGLKSEVQNLGVVTTKTFKDMNNEVYKYVDTYTNLKKSMSISDTYTKNDMGGFDFAGRVVNDQTMVIDAKAITQAHTEALKFNQTIDDTIKKNLELANSSAWKQQFQSVSDTSDELKKMGTYYSDLEKKGFQMHAEAVKMNQEYDKQVASIKESTLEQMKAQASTLQQRATSKGLSGEYSTQAKLIKQQTDELINRLKFEGRLTTEEAKQTEEMKEQLSILKAQITTDSAGQNPNVLDNEFQRRVQWFATGGIFYGMQNAAKQAVSTIKDVEMGMVELGRIMDDPAFNLEQYRENLFQLGVDYGQTFENTQDIALRWAQAGYNVADSLKLTETALLALNTAELDAANATDAMVGIMAQWQLQAGDLELVIDKINKTADDYTVSSQDLVDGLLRSSSAAKNMNMSIEETIALLTVMREASGRTGQEVGNALNSILSYIQRPKSIDTLEDMGIKMFTDAAKTNFRNALDIFKDVEANWETASDTIKDSFLESADDAGLFSEEMATALGLQGEWNDLQKRDIAQASAGVYRRNYYIGMIERLSNTQGILNGMMDAGGYSMAENERTMDTLEKKVESFKASLERLAVALGDAGYLDAMKGIVDAGTGLLEAFNDIDEETQQAIISFTSMFLLLKTGQKALSFMGISFGTFSKQAADATKTIGGLTLGLGGWVNVALLAASAGFALYNHLKKIDEAKMQAIQTGQQSIQTYQNEISELEKLSNEYDNIAEKTEKTEVEKARLNEIQKELAISFPELISGFDDEGNAMAYNTEATRALIDAKKDLLAQELEALAILAQGRLPELKDEIKETEDRITELTAKLRSGDTTEIIWISHKDGITEVKDMTEEYAQEVVELSESLREQKKEMSDLEKVVKQQEDAQVILNGTLEEARVQVGMLTEAELTELGVVKELSESSIQSSISRLNEDRTNTNAMIENTKARIRAMQSEMIALQALTGGNVGDVGAMSRLYTQSEIDSANAIERISMLAKNKAIEANRELIKLEGNAKDIERALANVEGIQASDDGSGEDIGDNDSKDEKYENKALENALKMLEHRKRISEETKATIKDEITELNRINSLYVKTADERMAMAERIYSAEKRLRDRTLQDSTNWINEKKNFNELSVEEEIAAWERVKKNQVNNIEAVKQATLNLYKLRSQVMADSFSREESSIKHLTKLGILSVEDQIRKYRELYEVKASSLAEEQARVENLFDLYKKQISDQQKIVKDAHDKKIEQIDEEAKKKKAMHQDDIEAINKELELLNREEEGLDHDKKMADLKEQLAYWQVRTSEDARKKVTELLKQIDEAEHKREVELKKQTLEDKKKVLEDEIKSVEDSAREEREKLEKSYRKIEIAFDDHSINLIALASTMSKGMFEEFKKNYLIPLENALRNADYGAVDGILSGVDDYAQDAIDKTYNSNNAQIYRLANQIVDLKRQYEYGGDPSAAQRATSIYDELSRLNPSVADSLHRMDYMTAQKYIEGLPKMHKGGKSLSYGAVEMMPGELTFPPDLSVGLERLFPLLSNLAKSNVGTEPSSFTDSRRETKIENLLRVDKIYMEDDVDERSLARELQRQLVNLM